MNLFNSKGGGCTIPLTLSTSASAFEDISFGTDCTSLPGVADVACLRGACAVRRCVTGWDVARDGERCQKVRSENVGAENAKGAEGTLD